ncbi:tryptophan-rich sensory protein [Agrococcus sp. ARC_14]|uniref:tryptophan-rich sensory protein n=1 Tax=Agrococcus sp. ARC_14 TaxID=2919927 RepID=UPI001F05A061|nr:tryptophan-rich sensory protein [Agrococcus sp. ARC_14]MCH1881727.1 tryptophan-rich sensory protein [Agrococcus sp. ARC_14]
MHPDRPLPTSTAERIRPWAVLIALPATLAMAALGSGAFGGQEVQASSSGALSADATPLAPASTAFSIWSLIYLGLAAYAIWQVLPKQRRDPRQQRVGWLAVASLVLNAAWILCAQAGLLPLTVVVIVLLLAVLAAIFELLQRSRADSLLETALVDGTFGLYLGWVSVATVANIAAWLADAGLRPAAFELPAVVVLAVVAAVGVAIAIRSRGSIAPSLAMLWGLSWIGVGRLLDQPQSLAVAVAAAAACVVIGAATVIARLRRVRASR